MEEPTLGDISDTLRRLETDLDQRLGRLELKVEAALAALPAGAVAAPAVAVAAPPPAPPAAAPSPSPSPAQVPAGFPTTPPPPGFSVPPPGYQFGGPPTGARPQLPPPPQGPYGPMPAPAPPWAAPASKPAFDLDDLTPERFVRWAGLVLVALAAIFLVSTAIQRGWIGPELQLAGATAAGLGLLGAAFRLRDHGPGWATSLGIAGATVLAFCATATNTWLDLVSPAVAVVAVAAATAVSVGAAWRLGRESVAVAAGLAALWVPPTLGLHHDLSPGFMALALAGVVVAATGLGLVRPWPLVRTGISWLAALMTLLALADIQQTQDRVTLPGRGPVAGVAVALATAALWLGPVLATQLVGRRPVAEDGGHPSPSAVDGYLSTAGEQLAAIDHRLLAVVPGWCWLGVAGAIGVDGSRPFGFLGLAVAAGFALLTAATWLRLPRALGLVQALGVSGVTAVALIAIIDGPLLMVALTVQTGATVVVAHRFRDTALGVSAAVTGAAAGLLAVSDIFRTIAERDPSVGGAMAQAFVVGAIGVSALIVNRFRRQDLAEPAFVVAWVLTLLWVVATFLPGPQGNVVVSGLWAAMAVGAIVAGLRWLSSTVRTVGLLTLALAVGKLLTVDLAVVDVFWRAGLFFLIGAGLLRLAYVLPRLAAQARARVEAAAEAEAEVEAAQSPHGASHP